MSNFKSPSFIHPIFLRIFPIIGVSIIGIPIYNISIPSHTFVLPPIVFKVSIIPTSPLVPMPDPMGLFSILNNTVAMGPVIADTITAGIQHFGFLNRFGICNIDVPRPWAAIPPHPFSLKLKNANPTMWAQQPAVAAPPANPDSPSIIQRAALLIGKVNTIPTTTEIKIPINNGLKVVAYMINAPVPSINAPIGGPTMDAIKTPIIIVIAGVRTMSIFVSFEISFPNSAPTNAAQYAPAGPPNIFPAVPVIVDANNTKGGAFSPNATATPMEAPVIC